MLFEIGVLFTVAVSVGIRRRNVHQSNEQPSTPAARPTPRSHHPQLYTVWLVASSAICLVVYRRYFTGYLTGNSFPAGCRAVSPAEEAALWDYQLHTTELRSVSKSAVAQTLFNQGMVVRYGYAQHAALKTFEAAVEEDPSCAMCYWGKAYALAPFANIVAMPSKPKFPYFSTQNNKDAREFVQKAKEIGAKSPKQEVYIAVMETRFPDVEAVDRRFQEWTEFLYGAKMLMVWKLDLMDLDAGALAAEAFVNCMPWDYYTLSPDQSIELDPKITWKDLILSVFHSEEKVKEFKQETGIDVHSSVLDLFDLKKESEEMKVKDPTMKELARVIEHLLLKGMEIDPAHPLILHLHIHVVEASHSDSPQKAIISSDRLANISLAWKSPHLIHMPSHIYARVGQYDKSVVSNEEAHEVDVELSRRCVHPYLPEHNIRLLIAGATLGGLYDKAEEYARVMRTLPEKVVSGMYMSKGREYVGLLHVWGLFGEWNEILTMNPPDTNSRGESSGGGYQYCKAMYHFYRFMAFSHREQSKNGRKLFAVSQSSSEVELLAFQEAAKEVKKEPVSLPGTGIGIYASAYWENTNVSLHYAEARLLSLKKDFKPAVEHFLQIESLLDEMGYIEPPWTPRPPKQCHAYLLLLDKQFTKAQQLYQEDLDENPDNPWSLLGLSQVYKALGKSQEEASFFMRYKSSGSVELTSSCPMLELDE